MLHSLLWPNAIAGTYYWKNKTYGYKVLFYGKTIGNIDANRVLRGKEG
jgi:hypothetical protein